MVITLLTSVLARPFRRCCEYDEFGRQISYDRYGSRVDSLYGLNNYQQSGSLFGGRQYGSDYAGGYNSNIRDGFGSYGSLGYDRGTSDYNTYGARSGLGYGGGIYNDRVGMGTFGNLGTYGLGSYGGYSKRSEYNHEDAYGWSRQYSEQIVSTSEAPIIRSRSILFGNNYY